MLKKIACELFEKYLIEATPCPCSRPPTLLRRQKFGRRANEVGKNKNSFGYFFLEKPRKALTKARKKILIFLFPLGKAL
jgi:hypothetical protein